MSSHETKKRTKKKTTATSSSSHSKKSHSSSHHSHSYDEDDYDVDVVDDEYDDEDDDEDYLYHQHQPQQQSNDRFSAMGSTAVVSTRRSVRKSTRNVVMDDDDFSVAPSMDQDVKSVVTVGFDDVYKRGRKVCLVVDVVVVAAAAAAVFVCLFVLAAGVFLSLDTSSHSTFVRSLVG
jgi:hypothetical protein